MQQLDKSVWKGLGISLALTVVTPIVAPIIIRASGPLLRAAGKAGVALYEKGRETAAEMGEVLDDLIAETKAEFARSDAELEQAMQKAFTVANGAEQNQSGGVSDQAPEGGVPESKKTA